MTRGYRSWFQDLINVWTMPATMLKSKVMYRQFIQFCFCKLKMLYMVQTFVSLLSGYASYFVKNPLNSALFPGSVFVLYRKRPNRLVFIMETRCVYYEV